MILLINNVEILFPYDYIYPEQYAYMKKLIKCYQDAYKSNTQIMLEMPTGTGKTVCLLSVTIAWLSAKQEIHNKLIFCSRTIAELEKVIAETKNLFSQYTKLYPKSVVANVFLAVILTSRTNLCINENILNKPIEQKEKSNSSKKSSKKASNLNQNLTRPSTAAEVDTRCYEACQNKKCQFYEGYQNSLDIEEYVDCNGQVIQQNEPEVIDLDMDENSNSNSYQRPGSGFKKLQKGSSTLNNLKGCWSISRLKSYAKKTKKCPYFMSKYLIKRAQVVVFSYNYWRWVIEK